MRAGRGARRHRGAAEAAVFQRHVDLDRRIAAAVEDLAGVDVDDRGHGAVLLHAMKRRRNRFAARPYTARRQSVQLSRWPPERCAGCSGLFDDEKEI